MMYIFYTTESFDSMSTWEKSECNVRKQKYCAGTSDVTTSSIIASFVIMSLVDFLPAKQPYSLFEKLLGTDRQIDGHNLFKKCVSLPP